MRSNMLPLLSGFLLVMTVEQGLHTISVCADETSTVLDSTTVYWQKMLPNSPMPPAIVELLASSSSGRNIQNQKPQLSWWGLVRKLIPFYGNDDVEKLIPLYGENNVENIIPFYPAGTKDENNGLPKIIPFYPGTKDEKNSMPRVIPFYPGTKDEKNGMPKIIPFYPGTKDHTNGLPKIIPFYPGTKDEKNVNGMPKIIPFYPGTKDEKNGMPKIIPFYPGTKDHTNGLPKIIPFYPGTKDEKNGMPKIIPFYPRTKDETNDLPRIIPFYPAGIKKDEINGLPKISMKRRTSSVQEDEHVTTTEARQIPHHLNHFFFGKEGSDHQNDAHSHIPQSHFIISNLFFLEESLTPGTTINLYILPSTSNGSPLLPRAAADSIAMATTSYPTILDTFSPVTRSMAEDIWTVLGVCEQSTDIKNQSCATSVESMAEFAASVLTRGDTRRLRAFSSAKVPAKGAMDGPRYKVVAARRATESMETMTCHDLSFPFPVFLCHSVNPTKVYEVTLEREDGEQAGAGEDGGAERMEVLAVCHLDTSSFEPEKMPGGIKPGEAPVCHFIGKDTILWANAPPTATAAA